MPNQEQLRSTQTESHNRFTANGEMNSTAFTNLDPSYIHFLAQNMNNQGCSRIANGDFDEAIDHLKNALQLARLGLSKETGNRQPCSCKFCRVESFLAFDVDSSETTTSACPQALEQKLPTNGIDTTGCTTMEIDNGNVNESENYCSQPNLDNNEAFIYRRPFFVSQQSIDQCHYMGTTLSFVILFNIAIAHHQKAIRMLPFISSRNERVAVLEQPLKLYELAYQLHFQCHEGSNLPAESRQETESRADWNRVNLRLMMLVTNNIGQIHKEAGNAVKHMQCLEHLLSAFMYMSDNNNTLKNNTVLTPSEKQGFFENLSPILKSNVYAAAA